MYDDGSRIIFGCTALKGTNKTGLLKADAAGYYPMVLGALDFPTVRGDHYALKHATELIDKSSRFHDNLREGLCKGEYGHPVPTPGQSEKSFLKRLVRTDPDRVCCTYREIWIDKNALVQKDGRPIISIHGELKPTGPFGPTLKDHLDDPYQNVAFSLRSICDEYTDRMGKRQRILKEVAGWDYVTSGGIPIATKYRVPSLESMDNELAFDLEQLERIAEEDTSIGVALEAATFLKDIIVKVKRQVTPRIFANTCSTAKW